MTGQNKHILSIYSSWFHSDVSMVIPYIHDALTKRCLMQLANVGIPVYQLNIKTKQEVLDYIYKEVIEAIPVFKKRYAAARELKKLNMKFMKKTLLFFMMTVFALSFVACSDDDKDDVTPGGSKVKLTATFHYLKNNEKKPDAGTALTLFKLDDKNKKDDYEYVKSNNYLRNKTDGKVIYPTIEASANNEGVANVDVESNTFYIGVYVSMIQPDIWGIEYVDAKTSPLTMVKEYALKAN